MRHQPVLIGEVLELLQVKPGGVYVDGTVGSAGHAVAILERAGAGGYLLGIDRDREALQRAAERLGAEGAVAGGGRGGAGRYDLAHGSFSDLAGMARSRGIAPVDGVLLDLGVSSDQLEDPGRGFSFGQDGPLDMRMDGTQSLTAAELVNGLSEETLSSILWELGEERQARRIARAVAAERARGPIRTTRQLAELIERVKGGRRGRTHPATQAFQALRMKVNDELGQLKAGLESAVEILQVGGRVAVIAFHSLEDRQVKRFFADHAGRWESLMAGGRAWRGEPPPVRIVTRKPVRPADREVEANPRARSAKLRVAERVEADQQKGR
jgi:16S rRNA (cytosine1402-N4)-methyltransferase